MDYKSYELLDSFQNLYYGLTCERAYTFVDMLQEEGEPLQLGANAKEFSAYYIKF